MNVLQPLKWIKEHLALVIPLAMMMGLALGLVVDTSAVKVAILPLTLLMIYPTMVAMNFRAVFGVCNYRAQGLAQLLNLVVVPWVAFSLGRLLLADEPLFAFGLLLVGLLPTSGMTISWTGFAGGNVKLAVRMTIIGLLVGALITPLYGSVLMGRAIDLPVGRTLQQIAIVIFLPMALGIATRWWLVRRVGIQRFDKVYKPRFPLVSTLGVIGVIIVAMSLKATAIVASPLRLLELLPPLLLFYAILFAVASIAGRLLLPSKDAVATVYGTAMRNLSVALAIALTVFSKDQGAEIALVVALAFVVQVQSAAWYVRLSKRIFPESRLSRPPSEHSAPSPVQ